MTTEPGHLFVIKGDLTKLACDGYVIPCDDNACVADYWQPLIPSLTEPCKWWLRVPGLALEGHFAEVPDTPHKVVLVDTVSHSEIDEMVEAVVAAIRRCAGHGLRRQAKGTRAMPLIGLPLPGAGEGTFPHRRGEVCQRLIQQLRDLVSELPVDVALVLKDARDYAFAQGVRRDHLMAAADWKTLGPRGSQLAAEADRLGTAAGLGQLSLFVGAGASIPLGLPSWDELVEALETAVGQSSEGDLYERAGKAREKDRDAYGAVLAKFFRVEMHAVGHALLGNLNTRRAVTTNYDNALELAMAGDQGRDSFRVMVGEIPDGGRPWLLKLHGDIADPRTVVLTRDDYERLEKRSSALYGVVGTLMLTSTLVFVGFSLKDQDFKTVAEQVQRVLDQAHKPPQPDPGESYAVSTPVALALAPDAVDGGGGVSAFVIGEEDDLQMSARRLEVMLDRMALRASQLSATSAAYLLDDRYRSANADKDELIERLKAVAALVDDSPNRDSAAWAEVRKALIALGHARSGAAGR